MKKSDDDGIKLVVFSPGCFLASSAASADGTGYFSYKITFGGVWQEGWAGW
jgi:hypothetical protein